MSGCFVSQRSAIHRSDRAFEQSRFFPSPTSSFRESEPRWMALGDTSQKTANGNQLWKGDFVLVAPLSRLEGTPWKTFSWGCLWKSNPKLFR
jgi:hypothetical protein